MTKWENGEFDELLRECKVIQSKIPSSSNKQQTSDHIAKSFANLFFEGKVNAALRFLDKYSSTGVLQLTRENIDELKSKHPPPADLNEDVIMKGEVPFADPI